MQSQLIQPSPNCIEYRLNNYHLHGIASCPFCNRPQESEPPKVLSTEEEIQKYQKEVTEKQKEANFILDVDPNDPDQLMELVEKYGDCPCCKGFVFNCEGTICEQLGQCYCFQKDMQDSLN